MKCVTMTRAHVVLIVAYALPACGGMSSTEPRTDRDGSADAATESDAPAPDGGGACFPDYGACSTHAECCSFLCIRDACFACTRVGGDCSDGGGGCCTNHCDERSSLCACVESGSSLPCFFDGTCCSHVCDSRTNRCL